MTKAPVVRANKRGMALRLYAVRIKQSWLFTITVPPCRAVVLRLKMQRASEAVQIDAPLQRSDVNADEASSETSILALLI
ncbi:hypothetical protein ACVCIE_15175 [Burkholderia glumae]|uniref:hypothetical protein n=1 Tax=Burkholderia glumae TaxID=337 RepID=UPI002036D069|nr:hypothetical protein [Burkholderia glumae]